MKTILNACGVVLVIVFFLGSLGCNSDSAVSEREAIFEKQTKVAETKAAALEKELSALKQKAGYETESDMDTEIQGLAEQGQELSSHTLKGVIGSLKEEIAALREYNDESSQELNELTTENVKLHDENKLLKAQLEQQKSQ